METMSTSVSALKAPRIPSAPAPRERPLFKSPNSSTHRPKCTHLFTKPNSIPHRPTASSIPNNTISTFPSPPIHSTSHHQIRPSLESSPPILHRKPAVGYAAALLDVALCNHALHVVERDVRRFLKLFKNRSLLPVLVDSSVDDDRIKGEALKEIAEKGKFQKHLVVVVKMLVNKSKVGMVCEVLEEFERIYDQLIGTRMVLVSSDKKLEKDKLLGIAEMVQKISGAAKDELLGI